MKYSDLAKSLKTFSGVAALERNFPYRTRRVFKMTFGVLSLVFFLLSSGIFIDADSRITGFLFVTLSIWSVFFLLDAYYFSFYFGRRVSGGRFAFELAQIIRAGKSADVTRDFVCSPLGKRILARCGIDGDEIVEFTSGRKFPISSDSFEAKPGRSLFRAYLQGLVASDREFANFLLSHSITQDEFAGAGVWTASLLRRQMEDRRWWSRESLSSIKSIGADWAYGRAYAIAKYSRPLLISGKHGAGFHAEEAKLLELALLRARESNALLVGDEGVGKMEVIEELARRIRDGEADAGLKEKKFVVFDLNLFSGIADDLDTAERELVVLFGEVVSAGNLILVIPDMPALLHYGDSVGLDIAAFLSPVLRSSELQLIAVSETGSYHKDIEKAGDLKQHFEIIKVKPADEDTVMAMLEENVFDIEEQGLIVTYPAVAEVLSSAERYFIDTPLSDIADDLLIEASMLAQKEGRIEVMKDDVQLAVEARTGVPTGAVGEEEKEKLLNLETLLHARIVGQDEAVKAISDAARRARSGIADDSRPIGSFLFLGPTGVGKTETAKALAEIFFGQDARLMRLDMSEYQTSDSIERLIGDARTGEPGTLSTLLRENQYGLLFLDEFEKSDSDVHDLFLQILDEGIFSDMRGEPVSARNTIIVATSNAGSDRIFKIVEDGKDLAGEKERIIDELIERGDFKPELLNRFDGVILFHPLQYDALKEVAKRELEKLSFRLKEKGIELVINDALVYAVAEEGKDPEFGARPIGRAIKDRVEQLVARKILAGELRPGARVEYAGGDLRVL